MIEITKEHEAFMKGFDVEPNRGEVHTDYLRWVHVESPVKDVTEDDLENNRDRFVWQYVTHDGQTGKWSGVATVENADGRDQEIYPVTGEYDSPQEVVAIHDREFAKWQQQQVEVTI